MSEIVKKINKASLWLMELGSEVESIANSSVGEKYKIMLLMTYIDIFSKIWSIYSEDTDRKQKEIFIAWMDKFMFSNSNENYKNGVNNIGNINSELFYKIRNSLVHFSSIPNVDNVRIFITSDNKSEFCNRYPDEIKEEKIIVLSTKILFPIFIQAVIYTIEEMAKQNDKYESTMLNIVNKLGKESCLLIKEKRGRYPFI
ncbi:hypothetical protein [uncultured Gammaproteobacteria bacterium]|jgi:hypothetical protein|nr:hypothetical protein [uncultured Gammaproteobacteria bacterium]CAC9625737.1 hypothetical protein [uncultured Gammaproteobacteria bacterium]CAC9964985.1 hypothetical protein [uncultured Gammaproteobacteria bacterium]CAC9968056.1 hypothetical protein [uncultured Gammaproteobacteria bacterium]